MEIAAPAKRPVTAQAKSAFFHIAISFRNKPSTEASTCLFHANSNQRRLRPAPFVGLFRVRSLTVLLLVA
jgi:hypothetical protein